MASLFDSWTGQSRDNDRPTLAPAGRAMRLGNGKRDRRNGKASRHGSKPGKNNPRNSKAPATKSSSWWW